MSGKEQADADHEAEHDHQQAEEAVFFALLAEVAWSAVVVMVLSSLLGGQLGVIGARRLDDRLLRLLVVVFGFVVGVRLLLS